MFAKTVSYTLNGIDAERIEVEAYVKNAEMYRFTLVGLPSNSVKESKERVCSAVQNSNFIWKNVSYTINLAPADLKKDEVGIDLSMAVAILIATNQLRPISRDEYALIGELSLDGEVRPVRGVLPFAVAALKDGMKGLIVPKDNAKEAALIQGLNVYGVECLNEAVDFLSGKLDIKPTEANINEIFHTSGFEIEDMFDVKGQYQVKRALEIAAAGGHNILMIGPPGSGKTMLARRLPGILPEFTLEEALETTKIFSVAGLLNKFKNGVVMNRPFRAPHHTISDIALIGGGSVPKPGEVSLSHNGVLFLDELPEFKKSALEVLRQPLEDGFVTISRAVSSLCFPAKFMLVASMNPCPCGYYGSNIEGHTCNCGIAQIIKYRSKISGPLLDRIDIHIEVPQLHYSELMKVPTGERSEVIRHRANNARERQLDRFKKEKIFCNAQMVTKHIRKYCIINDESKALLQTAMSRKGLSARAYDRILKLARTIADIENSENILFPHISEAVQYRSLDRKYWN